MTFGRAAGVPLKVHVNWFVIAILVAWSLAAGYFPQEYPGWSVITYWGTGMITALLFFVSVLLHELGHAVIAMQEGVAVSSITLFILGGVAHIANEPDTAGSEFRIVIAGPLVSMFLAGFFFFSYMVASSSEEASAVALYLCQINVILVVFNLIPGFPLDGGRILRATLWKFTGDFFRATRLARSAGLLVAFLFVLSGIGLAFQGNYFGGLWMAFIGWYLGNAAQDSYRQTMLLEPRAQLAVAEVVEEVTKPRPRYSGEV
jgi:Zn-dependent protease